MKDFVCEVVIFVKRISCFSKHYFFFLYHSWATSILYLNYLIQVVLDIKRFLKSDPQFLMFQFLFSCYEFFHHEVLKLKYLNLGPDPSLFTSLLIKSCLVYYIRLCDLLWSHLYEEFYKFIVAVQDCLVETNNQFHVFKEFKLEIEVRTNFYFV